MNQLGNSLATPILVTLLYLSSGCGTTPLPPANGPRLELVETYGEGDRSFTATATLHGQADNNYVTLRDVRISLQPETSASTSKLESLLENVTLTQENWKAWPETILSLPQ